MEKSLYQTAAIIMVAVWMMAAVLTEELPDDNALILSWGRYKNKTSCVSPTLQRIELIDTYTELINTYAHIYIPNSTDK